MTPYCPHFSHTGYFTASLQWANDSFIYKLWTHSHSQPTIIIEGVRIVQILSGKTLKIFNLLQLYLRKQALKMESVFRISELLWNAWVTETLTWTITNTILRNRNILFLTEKPGLKLENRFDTKKHVIVHLYQYILLVGEWLRLNGCSHNECTCMYIANCYIWTKHSASGQ